MGEISVVSLFRESKDCTFTLLMEVSRDGNCNFSDHFLPLCFGLGPPCSLAVVALAVRVVRASERQKNSSETKDHMWRS